MFHLANEWNMFYVGLLNIVLEWYESFLQLLFTYINVCIKVYIFAQLSMYTFILNITLYTSVWIIITWREASADMTTDPKSQHYQGLASQKSYHIYHSMYSCNRRVKLKMYTVMLTFLYMLKLSFIWISFIIRFRLMANMVVAPWLSMSNKLTDWAVSYACGFLNSPHLASIL